MKSGAGWAILPPVRSGRLGPKRRLRVRYSSVLTIMAACAAFLVLLGGCGDDKGAGPGNRAPKITLLQADPDTVFIDGTSGIACVAEDPDGDAMTYTWDPGPGTITGSGAAVTWKAPGTAATCTVRVTVADSKDKETTGEVYIEVIEGTLIVQTLDGLFAVDLAGNSFLLSSLTAHTDTNVEVLGTRIFTQFLQIFEIDHQGDLIATITPPEEIEIISEFVVLPDGGFAAIDNNADIVYFLDSQGTYVRAVDLPSQSPETHQNLNGVVVGDRLVVSESGHREIMAVDLTTFEGSLLKDLSSLVGWLGDIDYQDGVFYLAQWNRLLAFTEEGAPAELVSFDPEGNAVGVAVVGDYVYTTVNHAGKIYKTDIHTGETEALADGLNEPEDMEFLPVVLTAP
jgi:hypothetical protein